MNEIGSICTYIPIISILSVHDLVQQACNFDKGVESTFATV